MSLQPLHIIHAPLQIYNWINSITLALCTACGGGRPVLVIKTTAARVGWPQSNNPALNMAENLTKHGCHRVYGFGLQAAVQRYGECRTIGHLGIT